MSTIVKRRKESKSYTICPINDIAQNIKYGLLDLERMRPTFLFGADYRKVKGQVTRVGYCALVPMHIGNLPGREEVARVMELVRIIPHTQLAWRDRDGRSLYIVCSIAWRKGEEPNTQEQMQAYQANAYKMLHYLYSSQLQMQIDTEEPTLDYECPYSSDPDAYFNAGSIPFYVDGRERKMPEQINLPQNGRLSMKLLPGMDEEETRAFIFHNCESKALAEARSVALDKADWHEKAASLLARYCFESALPLSYALEHASWVVHSSFNPDLLECIFRNAYEEEIAADIPFGHIERTALLTMRTEAFLRANYDLRRNMLTGIVQFREKSCYNYHFTNLTDQALNSMTIRALKAGLGSWDKDIRRLINSQDIVKFNPIYDYLYSLPEWDGRDRVGEFCQRIPTQCPDLEHYIHTWMLSMVAHWLGKDRLHGNSIVPLLIGGQGCGKTTLASLILPFQLREYYNDKVDFRSEADLMTSLSRFALINIDEFDSLKRSQQPTLKYLLSKSEVKVRPTYGKAVEVMPRYASFIATTNLLCPLTDRTGSRRFVCIRITDGERIDTSSPIDYAQLYAQLVAEIHGGRRYWLDDAETEQLQRHNAPFMRLDSLPEMIDSVLLPPVACDGNSWLTADEIVHLLCQAIPSFAPSNATHRDLGRFLREKGYMFKRAARGMLYCATKR